MQSPRSDEIEAKYKSFKDQKIKEGADLTVFNMDDEIVVREFDNWIIIENRFPYDRMTSVNHMLIPRRNFGDFNEASEIEKEEHLNIKKLLAEEAYYDALVENFPKSKSVTQHVHVHLIRWKYTTENGANKNNI